MFEIGPMTFGVLKHIATIGSLGDDRRLSAFKISVLLLELCIWLRFDKMLNFPPPLVMIGFSEVEIHSQTTFLGVVAFGLESTSL